MVQRLRATVDCPREMAKTNLALVALIEIVPIFGGVPLVLLILCIRVQMARGGAAEVRSDVFPDATAAAETAKRSHAAANMAVDEKGSERHRGLRRSITRRHTHSRIRPQRTV